MENCDDYSRGRYEFIHASASSFWQRRPRRLFLFGRWLE